MGRSRVINVSLVGGAGPGVLARLLAGVSLVGLVGALLGCSTGIPGQDAIERHIVPSGKPIDLTPKSEVAGSVEGRDDAWTIVLPDGVETEERDSRIGSRVIFRMPDAGEAGVPGLDVLWQRNADVGALQDSAVVETFFRGNELTSQVERGGIDWPGARVAVLMTWNEKVPMEDGSMTAVQNATLWLEGANGTVGSVTAHAMNGELVGSAVWEALRTFRLGR